MCTLSKKKYLCRWSLALSLVNECVDVSKQGHLHYFRTNDQYKNRIYFYIKEHSLAPCKPESYESNNLYTGHSFLAFTTNVSNKCRYKTRPFATAHDRLMVVIVSIATVFCAIL
jgi:hypothetical protein